MYNIAVNIPLPNTIFLLTNAILCGLLLDFISLIGIFLGATIKNPTFTNEYLGTEMFQHCVNIPEVQENVGDRRCWNGESRVFTSGNAFHSIKYKKLSQRLREAKFGTGMNLPKFWRTYVYLLHGSLGWQWSKSSVT